MPILLSFNGIGFRLLDSIHVQFYNTVMFNTESVTGDASSDQTPNICGLKIANTAKGGYLYEGGSICNDNPFIAPSINVIEFYAICLTKDQSVTVIMVHESLFYLSKFNKLQTF